MTNPPSYSEIARMLREWADTLDDAAACISSYDREWRGRAWNAALAMRDLALDLELAEAKKP